MSTLAGIHGRADNFVGCASGRTIASVQRLCEASRSPLEGCTDRCRLVGTVGRHRIVQVTERTRPGVHRMNRSVPVLIVVALLIGGCVDSRPEQANDTVSDAGVTVSTLQAPHVTDSGDQKPPPLEIGTSAERVEVPGYDYTWGADDSEMGVSADWFGREEPTPLTVATSTVPVQWIDGAVLSASVSLEGDKCDTPLLEPSGPGEWVLAMPPAPGTYRVGFYGTSGRGKSLFAIMLTSTVDGPPLTPHAEVWWPDTIDQLQPSVEISGLPEDATMDAEDLGGGRRCNDSETRRGYRRASTPKVVLRRSVSATRRPSHATRSYPETLRTPSPSLSNPLKVIMRRAGAGPTTSTQLTNSWDR